MHDVCFLRNIGLASVLFALGAIAGCETAVGWSGQSGAGATGGASASSSSTGSTSSGMAGMGGSGGAGGAGGSGGSSLPACGMGTRASFAVDKLFLGDTNADGTPDPDNAWKAFGFDIDGRVSTKESTGLCKPAPGGSVAEVQLDGNNGIDNSFGKNVLPIFLRLAADFGTVNNEAIAMGDYTYLMTIFNVDQDACATSSSLFLGSKTPQIPKFEGTDVWPIDANSLLNPMNLSAAKSTFPNTRLEGGMVHAGPPSRFDIILNIAGFNMVLPIRQARMAFKLEPDFQSITAGQLGGVIRTEDLVKEISRVAAAFDVSFCDQQSPTLQSILNHIRQKSDIMQDGTQDPTKQCDGISIGLGFTMKPVTIGNIAPAANPPPDPCMP